MLTLGGKPLQVPILQGGMGVGVSLGGLAGAVAACGGMGCISTADAGYREPDFARDPAAANHRALTAEIQKAKAIAGGMGLVAINAMVATRDYVEAIRTAVAAGVDAVVSGAGLPLELPGIVGTKEVAIAPIVSSARAAKLILRRWAKGFDRTADFVVIEGMRYRQAEQKCFRVLCDYLRLLERWKEEYAPKQPEEDWNPLFVEALHRQPYIEYLLDLLLSDSIEERAFVVAEYGKEVRKIEQRISEFIASHPAGCDERSRSHSAGTER